MGTDFRRMKKGKERAAKKAATERAYYRGVARGRCEDEMINEARGAAMKPTIAELEKILNEPAGKVDIWPDGSVRVSALREPELQLLLTVARLLRAHLAAPNVTAYQRDDLAALDEAIAPWSPSKADPVKRSHRLKPPMSDLEIAAREILDSADKHAGSVPQGVVMRLRQALGQPEAQETREPEE